MQDDLERIALATIFVYPHLLEECEETITATDFRDLQHNIIATALFEMLDSGLGLSPLLVYSYLARTGKSDLVDKAYLGDLPKYAEVDSQVLDEFKSQSLLKSIGQISADTYQKTKGWGLSGRGLLENLITELQQLDAGSKNSEILLLSEVVTTIVDKQKAGQPITKQLKTKWKKFDEQTGGINEGELMVIGARPEMGKTVTSAHLAVASAEQGVPSAIISLEMLQTEIAVRMITNQIAISSKAFRTNTVAMTQLDLVNTSEKLQLAVYLVSPQSSAEKHIFELIKRLIALGVKTIIIDYLQLIAFDGRGQRSRDEQVGHFTKRLKNLTLTKKLYTVLYSSLTREVDKDPGRKKPKLHHLKSSGDIEADADIVIGLWRGIKYGYETDEKGNNIATATLFIKLKSRGVQFDDFYLYWKADTETLESENDNTIIEEDEF